MTGEQVYVSHTSPDLGLVDELFSTVRNFPFGVHVALEEADSGSVRNYLKGRLANSDVVVAVLTETATTDEWVNQEIGYAVAKGIPVLPLYEDESYVGGFIDDLEGIRIDRHRPSVTIFYLLSALRDELAPLGSLSVPDWYVRFPCTVPNCGHPVTLEIEHGQSKLRKLKEHGQPLVTSCDTCLANYYFDPATIGFLRRETVSE